MISIIAAIDAKRGLGRDNKLMWNISEDLVRFKKLTQNHPVIMGRKTFESIGKPLPNRTNFIITQNLRLKIQNCKVTNSLKEAVELARKSIGSEEVFIIGGGQIYKQGIEIADRLYLTLVEGDFGADTFFPEYVNFSKIISDEKHESGNYKFRFLTLEK